MLNDAVLEMKWAYSWSCRNVDAVTSISSMDNKERDDENAIRKVSE
jgi:hypothetical protein